VLERAGDGKGGGVLFLDLLAVWLWYLETQKTRRSWIPLPWYPQKTHALFADASPAFRRVLWRQRLSVDSETAPLPSTITTDLIDVLAMARIAALPCPRFLQKST